MNLNNSKYNNFYSMLEDIVDHIKLTRNTDPINTINVEYNNLNREVEIEFVSTSNKTWACPMIKFYAKTDPPDRWKNIMLNSQKSNNPFVFLVEYLNKTWINSTN